MTSPETSADGHLLVVALATPFLGAMAAFVAGRHAGAVTAVVGAVCTALAIAIFHLVAAGREPLVYLVGGWTPPLGVSLRADGFSAAMMVVSAIVLGATGLCARLAFVPGTADRESRMTLSFWVLFLGLWGALNAVFTMNDLFSIYVALELLTFAAVPLVCLEGKPETFQAALRYLVFAVLGSLLYLLGVGLLYGRHGMLDIGLLSGQLPGDPVSLAIVATMLAGILVKGALFPLHFWLPPAHAGAPPPASALLSALVVKAAFFLAARFWFEVLGGASLTAASHFLGLLGACAVLYGSLLALRQERLKLMIAYSTIAQIGYLFLVFPLATANAASALAALTAGLVQAASHAMAKACLFIGTGLAAALCGSDRLADLRGLASRMPLTALAFAFAGLSLVGFPPSGGFRAKWMLIETAILTGQWWWALVMLAGGLLAMGYIFKILRAVYAPGGATIFPQSDRRQPRLQWAAVLIFALAIASMSLGFSALCPQWLMAIGHPELEATFAPP